MESSRPSMGREVLVQPVLLLLQPEEAGGHNRGGGAITVEQYTTTLVQLLDVYALISHLTIHQTGKTVIKPKAPRPRPLFGYYCERKPFFIW